jgi:hypothetical protein
MYKMKKMSSYYHVNFGSNSKIVPKEVNQTSKINNNISIGNPKKFEEFKDGL